MEGCTYTHQPRPSFRFLLSLAGGHDEKLMVGLGFTQQR